MSTLSKIETGDSTPTLEVLLRISAAVGQTPDKLLDWNPSSLSIEAPKRAALVGNVESLLASLPAGRLEALAALLKR